MANLQKTLDALQPYVIGIRYVDGLPVVDTVFKENWTLPESTIVNVVKGEGEINYYMLYSEKEGIGIDELLDYVNTIIKANVEREKKHELLKEKVEELKKLFSKNTLSKLNKLKFVFGGEDFIPEIDEINLEEPKSESAIENNISDNHINVETDKEQISDEELEMIEEEKRAENFRKIQKQKKKDTQVKKLSSKIELPPKKILQAVTELDIEECECGPDEACDKCINKKDL